MKILFLQDDFPPQSFGGAGISTYELALGMKEAGHDVSVITTCRKASEAGEFNQEGLHIFRIWSDYPARWRSYVSINNRGVVKRVEEIFRKLKPDVVHANNIHAHISYASLKAARKYVPAVIFTARDAMTFAYEKLATPRYLKYFDARVTWLDNLRQAGKRWNPLRNFFIRRYLKYAHKIFAISRSLKDALEKNGIKNAEVIYNGINVEAWRVDEVKVKEFKEKFNLNDKKVIFYNGRLSVLKGSEVVLKMFKKVKSSLPETVLLIAGIGESNSEENIVFTGWLDREDMKVAYAVSDIVLMPSICLDAFGRVNIEAMASKKPVVGTCYGGTPEIVEDGVTGYIVNPLYPEQIAEKTLELLKNPGKAKQFGEAGYERAKTHFNLEDKAKEYISVYKSLLK
jgi:glycosyltransferase involved in cell wall biosynthesis